MSPDIDSSWVFVNDMVAGLEGGGVPQLVPLASCKLPALGNEKWNTSPSLVSGEARGTPSTRDLDLFSPLSGRDDDVRVPPDTAWEEVERKVGPDEGLMSRLSVSGSTPVYINDLLKLRVSGRARRSWSS